MSRHVYSSDFFDYIDVGSRTSARAVANLLLQQVKIGTLLDVGSGHGAWAAEWLAAGVKTVVAVDGDYVSADQLAIPADRFLAHDLSRPLKLGKRFDLVQSLEVAEHIAAEHADTFVANLVSHGDVVLFSAAVPHQGGEHHVNEQPPEYWRERFASHGYEVFDWLRPRIADRREIKAWYRYNSLIYANRAGQKRLSKEILDCRVSPDETLRIGGDFAWSLRRAAVRLMPATLVKPVAMARSIVEVQFRK
jgi:cyclopropane fatty-acyl-phospholipid synthase-like methyltransferase